MAYPPCSAEDTIEGVVDAVVETAAGDGSEVDFVFSGALGAPTIEVYVDGGAQRQGASPGAGVDYTVEEDDPDVIIHFAEAPADGAVLLFRAYL